MAYKDILVYAGGTGFEARVRLAAGLAEAYGAHVVGLHVAAPPDLPPYVEAQLTRELLQAHERLVSQERDACQAGFDAAFKGASVSAEWRASEGDEADILQLHGRYADLVVLGQEDPETPGADVAGQIVLMLGRPVLVVPYVGTFETVGQRVLVAWDASRAAARAIGDAMAILQRAEAVSVLSLNPDEDHAAMAGVDIATHMARHGVTVEAQHLTAKDMETGAMLLSRAADFGADMIVMGAYGHARWRELVLGGVTEHMLGHMTVPVLMSH